MLELCDITTADEESMRPPSESCSETCDLHDLGDVGQLPQTLDLTQANSLRENMISLLRSGNVRLDASAVERMSTPCAQVLLVAGRAAEAAGTPFQIVNGSDAFRTAIADLGLKSQFTNWMV